MSKNIYWIQAAEPHRVAIVARPRGGDWLEVDVQLLSREGIGVLVSMLTANEAAELGLSEEQQYCDRAGIRYIIRAFVIEQIGFKTVSCSRR